MYLKRVEQTVKYIKDQLTVHKEKNWTGGRINKYGGRYIKATPESNKIPASLRNGSYGKVWQTWKQNEAQ